MSKIGRKPIELGPVKIEIQNNIINYKGPKGSGKHQLPSGLKVEVVDNKIKLTPLEDSNENNMLWGLHRALLFNKITGVSKGFSEQLNITGLGFKGAVSGNKITFSLGFSHKIIYDVPEGISVEIDKTGQIIVVKGVDKQTVGLVCSEIRALRPPEPYKGTGVKLAKETILRKAGKTKAAA